MNKVKLYTLAIISGLSLKAQSQSYLNLSASWTESSASCCCSGYCDFVDVIITLPGDSIINGLTYYKTYYTGTLTVYDLWEDSIVSVEPISHPGKLIREENSRFYRYHPSSGTDIMFANFNLEVGDTAVQVNCQSNLVVDHIDTLYLGNEPRRIFYFAPEGSYSSTLIEGIGSSRGLFEGPCQEIGIESGTSLLCFGMNNNSVQISSSGECGIISSTSEKDKLHKTINIFPNPVKDALNIEISFPTTSDLEINIFNIQGHLVRTLNLPSKSTTVDLSTLLPGIYFMSFIHDGVFYSQKLLKVR